MALQAKLILSYEKETMYREAFNMVYHVVMPMCRTYDYGLHIKFATIAIEVGKLSLMGFWTVDWSLQLHNDCPLQIVKDFSVLFGIRKQKSLYANLFYMCCKEIFDNKDTKKLGTLTTAVLATKKF